MYVAQQSSNVEKKQTTKHLPVKNFFSLELDREPVAYAEELCDTCTGVFIL